MWEPFAWTESCLRPHVPPNLPGQGFKVQTRAEVRGLGETRELPVFLLGHTSLSFPRATGVCTHTHTHKHTFVTALAETEGHQRGHRAEVRPLPPLLLGWEVSGPLGPQWGWHSSCLLPHPMKAPQAHYPGSWGLGC